MPGYSRGSPLGWLAGPEGDADGLERRGAGLLRRAAEDVGLPGDLEALKPRSLDDCLELCFQQSAGDSTLPEV
ncbi:MAG: hypothetical protein V3V35_09410, partial [Dehalococcoidia bacterium]